jgi:hypothetical protein
LERRIVALENGCCANNILGNGTAREVEDFRPRRSYSIEAEDLLAETIFNAVLKYRHAGTYLDIGAAHPVQHSNTYLFYVRGWRGICVEPNPEFYALYKTYRPRDTALNVGIAPEAGTLQYHRFTQPLINGFFGQDLIDRHIGSGETYLGLFKSALSWNRCVPERENQKADRLSQHRRGDFGCLDSSCMGLERLPSRCHLRRDPYLRH